MACSSCVAYANSTSESPPCYANPAEPTLELASSEPGWAGTPFATIRFNITFSHVVVGLTADDVAVSAPSLSVSRTLEGSGTVFVLTLSVMSGVSHTQCTVGCNITVSLRQNAGDVQPPLLVLPPAASTNYTPPVPYTGWTADTRARSNVAKLEVNFSSPVTLLVSALACHPPPCQRQRAFP